MRSLWIGAMALVCVAACDDGDGATADTPIVVVDMGTGGEGGEGGEGGMSGCAEGETTCSAACVDTQTDAAHCGACGEACAAGETCEAGGCIAPDPCARAPLEDCDASDDAQPPPLNEHAAGYDNDRQLMVIFGGNTAVPEMCGFPAYTFLARTWIFYDYDTGCGQWVEVGGAQPPGRARHAATFGGGYFWIHGGRYREAERGRYEMKDDLWRFDPATRTWQEMQPQGPSPSARFNHTLVYDDTSDQILLYAGNTDGSGVSATPQGDVWAYSLADDTWRTIEATNLAPPGRLWHDALWDSSRQRMVVFGGADASAFNQNARYFADVIAFDPATGTWSQLHNGRNGTRPDGRFWSRFVHDTQSDVYLMFAGHDDQTLGNANDTWTFNPESRQWSAVSGADAFNRPANGFCDFPADFTTVAAGTPERRNAHTMVWSQTCNHAVAFGGKTDCGAVNDVWRFGEEGWSNPVMATEGEACLRWRANPDNCANMCF